MRLPRAKRVSSSNASVFFKTFGNSSDRKTGPCFPGAICHSWEFPGRKGHKIWNAVYTWYYLLFVRYLIVRVKRTPVGPAQVQNILKNEHLISAFNSSLATQGKPQNVFLVFGKFEKEFRCYKQGGGRSPPRSQLFGRIPLKNWVETV